MSPRTHIGYLKGVDMPEETEESNTQLKQTYNVTVPGYSIDVISALIELQTQRRLADSELNAIKTQLEQSIQSSKDHFKTLESSVAEIKSMAKDAMTVSVGLDGKNGLRGAIEKLTQEFSNLPKDVEFLKQTANHYHEMKSMVIRMFMASIAALFVQFGGAMWYTSEQHNKQEVIRRDLNRVMEYLDQRHTDKNELKRIDR